MTMVGGGGSDNSAQLLDFVLTLKKNKRDRQHQEALTYLNSLHPGEKLGLIGAKMFERATGVKGDPNRVLSEETFAHKSDQNDLASLIGMSPDLQVGLAQNRVLNYATGTSGPQSIPSYKSGVQAAETTGKLKADVAAVGAQSFAVAPPAEKVAIAQRQTFGETGKQTIAQEGTAQATNVQETAKGKVLEAQGQVATDFYKDPANSAFGQMLTKNKLDPVATAQAFASGQGALITGMQEIQKERIQQAGETQRTGMVVAGELAKQLNQGRIDVAKDFSTKTGVPVRTSLAIEDAIETGHNPFAIVMKEPDGTVHQVPGETVQAWLKAKELAYKGYVREQVAKNNPQVEYLKQLAENAQKFGLTDPVLMTALNTAYGKALAAMITEGESGHPRPMEPGPDQEAWDKQRQMHFHAFGMIGKSAIHMFGLGGNVTTTEPAGMDTSNVAVPTKTSNMGTVGNRTPGQSGTANMGTVGSQAPAGPGFQNPDAAKAIGNVLGGLQDSTLIKR